MTRTEGHPLIPIKARKSLDSSMFVLFGVELFGGRALIFEMVSV